MKEKDEIKTYAYTKAVGKININNFISWLRTEGCRILEKTNQYELLRFKGKEVGVLYISGSVSGGYVESALIAFKYKKKWNGKPISTGRSRTYSRKKKQLIKRDGTNCFYCGLPLEDDITVEHIDPLTAGGKNEISNMVLAHEKCNQDADTLGIVEKITIAIDNRVKLKLKTDKKDEIKNNSKSPKRQNI